MKVKFLLTIIFLAGSFSSQAADRFLEACWHKQAKSLNGSYIELSFKETIHELEHDIQPWKQQINQSKGMFWVNPGSFLKKDTLSTSRRDYYSRTVLTAGDLLYLDYGDNDLYPVTRNFVLNELIHTLRYSPIMIIDYLHLHDITADNQSTDKMAIYKVVLNGTQVSVYIRKADNLVAKVVTLSQDDQDERYGLFGDLLTSYNYSIYQIITGTYYPGKIDIEKLV